MNRFLLIVGFVAIGAVSAAAADLPARTPAKAPPMADAGYNWSGFYVGGNAGYGVGNADTDLHSTPLIGRLVATTISSDPRGMFGGAQIGYNRQFGSFVVGLEADFQGANIDRTTIQTPVVDTTGTPFAPGSYHLTRERIDWFGTVRGRAGFTVAPTLLLYATGGVAYGNVGYSVDTSFPVGRQYLTSFSTTKAGWTAGAGAEWAFTRNWSAKAEYLYMDFGGQSGIANPTPPNPPFQAIISWKTQQNLVRVGVNYKWGDVIVAKY